MQIAATVCDGFLECFDGSDETFWCRTPSWKIFLGVGVLPSLIGVAIIAICKFKRGRFSKFEPNLNLQRLESFESKLRVLEDTKLQQAHMDENFEEINKFLLFNDTFPVEEHRIENNKKYYELELKYHNENIAETKCCMKNNLEFSVCRSILDDIAGPSCSCIFQLIPKLSQWKRIVTDLLKNKSRFIFWLWDKARRIVTDYLDFFKDTFLLAVIFYLVGGFKSMIYFPTKFTSVIVYCFLGANVLPLFLSSIQLARDNPDMVFKQHENVSTFRKFMLRILIVFLSFLNPLILINALEANKEKVKKLISEDGDPSEISTTICAGLKIRKQYIRFIRTELGLEAFYQITGQILLLLLTQTSTSTTEGLPELFKEDNTFLLVISIAWSLKTCVSLQLKSINVEKAVFEFKSKYLVVLPWSFCE